LIEQAEALGEPPEDLMLLFLVLCGVWDTYLLWELRGGRSASQCHNGYSANNRTRRYVHINAVAGAKLVALNDGERLKYTTREPRLRN